MSTSAAPIEIDSQFLPRLRRRAEGFGTCAIAATLAVATLVMMVAFWAGKMDPSNMMLFAVPVPAASPTAPVASVKEILTGMQPVRNQIGAPVMEAKANREIMDSLSLYDKCDTYCCRRDMLAKAVAAAALTIGAPALAAETKTVLAGTDAGGLLFVPNEITVCAGDTVVWKANKGMPHNVVFDEENVPAGVDAEKLSQAEYLNNAGDTYQQTFTVKGTYEYFCAPHRGGGMVANLIVS